MDEQYSPETDENHLKTMRMLSLIMTILLAVAVVASLWRYCCFRGWLFAGEAFDR